MLPAIIVLIYSTSLKMSAYIKEETYEKMKGAQNVMYTADENSCYAIITPVVGEAKSNEENYSNKKLKIVIIILFVIMLFLIVGAVGACITFAVEVNQLKYETADLNNRIQQLNTSTDSALTMKGQELTASIDTLFQKVVQNYSTLESITQLLTNDVQAVNGSLVTILQQGSQNHSAFENIAQLLTTNIQELNASLEVFLLNYSALRNEIQLLQSFSIDPTCTTLPPSSPSGYYWVRASNGSPVSVYCDMSRSCGGVTGGWMRVAYLDMTNNSHQCPSSLLQRTDSNVRTCAVYNDSGSCSSVTYGSHGIQYSHVCGKIRGFHINSLDGYLVHNRLLPITVESNYVDGVSLTHRNTQRHHIWTFTARSPCPCGTPPSFVNNDYFCDGSQTAAGINLNNPLWDGEGCDTCSTCTYGACFTCTLNNPPWFHRRLPQPTTDDIEMRLCRDEDRNNEDISIDTVEIYIQ